jgi:predicted transcriptional regulator
MKIEPGLFTKRDRQAEAESIARARADIKAGRFVDHAEVADWLKGWARDPQKRMPREWLE